MKRWIRLMAIIAASLLAIGLIVAVWLWRTTRYVPEFYEAAVQASPPNVTAEVEGLREEFSELRGDASRPGGWNAEFTDDQINAWLIQQLMVDYPSLLPQGVSDPRVVIREGRLLAAARFRNEHFDTVVSVELTAELTPQPNVLAVRLMNLKAGALPLPIGSLIDGLTQEAAKRSLDLRWQSDDTGNVALVTIPSDHPKYPHKPVIVESIRFAEGTLIIEGITGKSAIDAYSPRGPINQFASGYQFSSGHQLSSGESPSPRP
jgi:hypothetical protein